MVRRVFGPLQLVPDRFRNKSVQEGTQGLPNIERHDPVSSGQAPARRLSKENGEGAHRRDERQEAVTNNGQG